ncbi:MAG: translation initiation factor [Muribaculaceae bacterium]|nr:translation initiation factor [Muribaculaceae bacterium]
MDWQDALGSLLNSVPQAPDTPTPSEQSSSTQQSKGRLDIILEKKGRAGKSATIISGFTTESDDEISAIAARLKSRLGTGGSARGGEILIQGDRRTDVQHQLTELGYKARII